MKKLYVSIIGIIFTVNLYAQSPKKMSYQAVIRAASNALVTNHTVGMQISILKGSETGTAVYVETQTPTTNSNGLISLEIGNGNGINGDFNNINWHEDTYFIKTETDPTGGTNYTITGISQLLSVPYALHASTAESIIGGISEIDGSVTNEIQVLSISNDTIYLSSGGFAKLPAGFDGDFYSLTNVPADLSDGDDNTQLDSSDIADLGYVAGGITEEIDGSTINEIQQLTRNGDTIFISNGNYIVLPGLSYLNTLLPPPPVQARLDSGETPLAIYLSDISLLDSLYGKTYQGGLIAYFNTADGTGLIANDSDQGMAEYGCFFENSGGTETSIGAGESNTTLALICSESLTAAKICFNFSSGGYSDWFSPSMNELNELYINLHSNGFGSFQNSFYWSSSELDLFEALAQNFTNGSSSSLPKTQVTYVRPVRSF